MGNPGIIEASDLCFSFGDKRVLEDISFAVGRGEFVSFIGPSGCGKTTLLNLAAGVLKPQTGTLSVRADRLSFVFQNDTLLPWRTAFSNVLLPLEAAGLPVDGEATRRGRLLLSEMGLEDCGALPPAELSGGMKKRVELCRALIMQPDLLILDEPFASLDLITRERLNTQIRGLCASKGVSAVMVTHSVDEACFLSDRVYVLSALPARIIDAKNLPKNGHAVPEQFLLSVEETEAERAIRRDAKVLWTKAPEEEPVQGAGGKKTAGGSAARAGSGHGADLPEFLHRHWSSFLIPVELAALFLLLSWIKTAFSVPDAVFPAPAAVAGRFVSTLLDGTILPDLAMTVMESLVGFLIAFALTAVLGYAIAKSRLLARLFMPYLIGANAIPSVALAPFLVLWFGFGAAPRIASAVILIFFPMLISNISAIGMAERSTGQLVGFFKPGRMRTFRLFELPAALPQIVSGVKVSGTLSVIGAVVGEFVSGHQGLGALVGIAKASFDFELMFVGLLWLILMGLAYYAAAQLAYRAAATRLR